MVEQPQSQEDMSQYTMLHDKRILLAVILCIIVLTGGVILVSRPSQEPLQEESTPVPTTSEPTTQPSRVPTTFIPPTGPSPTPSAEMIHALDEAKASAEAYSKRQETLKQDIPWLRRFPFVTDRYFIFFRVSEKKFIVRLMPHTGDDIQALKKIVISDITAKGIPISDFPIDWTISPTY